MTAGTLFTFRQLPIIRTLLAERGIAIEDVLRETGLGDAQAAGEVTAPLAKMQAFLEAAAQRLGSPLFGLELAQRIPEGAYGVTEFVARTAPSIRVALDALCELSPLVNPALDMRYIADDLGCELRFGFAQRRDALGPILNEYTVAYIARQFAGMLGRPLPLERAWFAHARAEGQREVAARLGCDVTFGEADCGFAVASDVIDSPIATGNRALFEFLLTQARTQLANLATHDVIAQVARVVEAHIASHDLDAASVAKTLAISQRTLQRQLTEAGTSYRTVLAMVRRRRRAELERAGLPEADIAARLGFSSAKTMRRSLDEPDDAGGDGDRVDGSSDGDGRGDA